MEIVIITAEQLQEIVDKAVNKIVSAILNTNASAKPKAEFVKGKMDFASTKILTLEEVCQYTGSKKSYMKKLTMDGLIPFSKPPLGRKLYFDRERIDQWMLSNATTVDGTMKEKRLAAKEKRDKEREEIEIQAATYVATHPTTFGSKRRQRK
jgi:excisionase family DNA binding protein